MHTGLLPGFICGHLNGCAGHCRVNNSDQYNYSYHADPPCAYLIANLFRLNVKEFLCKLRGDSLRHPISERRLTGERIVG